MFNKAKKTTTAKLRNYLIVETTGVRWNIDEMLHLKAVYFETLDVVLNEMKRRFNSNDKLLLALTSAELDMDLKKMEILENCNVKIPSKYKIIVVKNFIRKTTEKNPNTVVFNELFKYRRCPMANSKTVSHRHIFPITKMF